MKRAIEQAPDERGKAQKQAVWDEYMDENGLVRAWAAESEAASQIQLETDAETTPGKEIRDSANIALKVHSLNQPYVGTAIESLRKVLLSDKA